MKKNRFYLCYGDLEFCDFNYVVTPEGKQIEYSFLCIGDEDFPPVGYRLVYETDDDNYRIIANPYNIMD